MKKYRLIAINGFQEPELIGEYEKFEDMLMALLIMLKSFKAIMVEVIEVK